MLIRCDGHSISLFSSVQDLGADITESLWIVQNADEPVVTQALLMPIANVDWMEDIG